MISKPPFWVPGINRRHPRAEGVVAAWLLQEGGGSRINDLVGGAPGTDDAATTRPDWVGGAFGHAISLVANDFFSFDTGTPEGWGFNDTNECSIIFHGLLTDSAGNRGCLEISATGSQGTGFSLFYSNGNGIRFLVIAGGRSTSTGHITSADISAPYEATIVATYSESFGQYLYSDGEVIASDNTMTGTFNNTFDDGSLPAFCRLAAGGNRWIGDVDFIIVLNRALTPPEVQSWTTDPFAPFRPPRREVEYSAAMAAPGGPTLLQMMQQSRRAGLMGRRGGRMS